MIHHGFIPNLWTGAIPSGSNLFVLKPEPQDEAWQGYLSALFATWGHSGRSFLAENLSAQLPRAVSARWARVGDASHHL